MIARVSYACGRSKQRARSGQNQGTFLDNSDEILLITVFT